MKIEALQHVAFEGPGVVGDWARKRGHQMTITRLDAGETLPNRDSLDCLVVMGGPMGVADEARYPWLTEEKKFLREVLDRGIPVIGICLGAQLIADALGARVYQNRHREIGWFPVKLTGQGASHPWLWDLPETFTCFHWHGDTFDLPSEATLLASSQACPHQAFAHGDNTLALQFHLDTTPDIAAKLLEHCADELDNGPFTQQPEDILTQEGFPELRRLQGLLLDNFFQLSGLDACHG